ncbi:MAG: frr [Gammaproteobacteria bacterium]|jgi:ribosome recycling factor|nr:frr [Gammaproteobacteria bacterium]
MTIAETKQNAEQRMRKSIESLQNNLIKLRTGRAHPSLLDQVVVSYYGNDTPLNQVSNVTTADARTLLITPWEKNLIPSIEKAIYASGLGLNPVTTGDAIRVPLPPLNEERRKEFIKIVKGEAEDARVAIRNIRRDANTQLKELVKAKDISEDDEKRAQDDVQKLTDKYIAEVDKLLAAKETELMEV